MPAEGAAAVSRQVDDALAAAAGGSPIWPGEAKDVRLVKLPAGGGLGLACLPACL
jgi:hypothetical protein